MKKYIFVDIDGTLNDSNRKISNNNILGLQECVKRGNEIIFCSGRCNNYLVGISNKCHVGRYLISSNGSMIYDNEKKEIIYQYKIPFNIIKKLYLYCINNDLVITFNTEDYRYCSNTIEENDKVIIKDVDDLIDKNITQLVIGSYEYDKMIKIKDYLDTIKEIEIVNISTTLKMKQLDSSEGFFYDVTCRGINKGFGIKKLIDHLNINKSDCIAIGDHINDMTMFDEVGFKIAMGNAYQELKEKADYITETNDEDGVKYALEYIDNIY